MGLRRRAAAAALGLAALAAGCASTSEDETLAVNVYLQNAQGYYDGGHYDQALGQFRRALQVDPGNARANQGEAFALLYLGMKEAPSAEESIRAAEERMDALDPGAYGENGWKVFLGRGMVRSRMGDLYDRLAALRRKQAAEAKGPESERARKGAEEAEAERDRYYARAAEAFQAVLGTEKQALAEDNLAALFFLAKQSALKAKAPAEYEEALGYFRRYEVYVERSKRLWGELAKKNPELKDFYEQRRRGAEEQEIELRDLVANIHFKRRDHVASIAELEKVIKLDSTRAAAYFNRGRNLEELGRFGAAADDYHRFLALTDLPASSPLVLEATERMQACEEKVKTPPEASEPRKPE